MMKQQANILSFVDGPCDADNLERELDNLVTDEHSIAELCQMRNYFAKFVPDTVKRLIAANPEAPAFFKSERDISVLFLDISGYARLSEQVPPSVLNALVERYFSVFLDRVHEAGGDINEIAGDGFMAIFQDTNPCRHVIRAADAALALLAATEMLNKENLDQPLAVHMGLNTGIAFVGLTRLEGLYGSRWTFTASGSTTNLASRLVDIAEPGQILLGPETMHRLGRSYPARKIGCERLKNFAEHIDIYCLLHPSHGQHLAHCCASKGGASEG